MSRLTLLSCSVVVLLVASTSALALHQPGDEGPGAQRPNGARLQPVLAVGTGPEVTADDAGRQSPSTTVLPSPPPPPDTSAQESPAAAGPAAGGKPPSKPAPSRAGGKRCGRYDRGGSVHPLCAAGKRGAIGDVVVEKVPGTNVVVNRAWAANVTAFFGAARAAGFVLQAYDEAGPGYGSFRTAAMQMELRRRGYPANPPGLSMHEWGLAIDLSCNGDKFTEAAPACRDWVRANAGRFGIQNLPSEPWHWSTNGN